MLYACGRIAQTQARLAPLADRVLIIPARTMADDQETTASQVLAMGSVVEGALFVVLEVMIFRLKTLLGITSEDMRSRHTNME